LADAILSAACRAGIKLAIERNDPAGKWVEEWPHVAGEKVSAYHVLCVGLRTLVVALDPLFFRPLAQPDCGRRAFPGAAGRAGSYRRQERCDGVTATDGALARGNPVVCRGALASYRGHPCCGSAQRLLPGRSAHVFSGRFGWLVNPFADVLLWLLIPGLAGTWEEPGFRGYALPRLQFRHSALLASLILGVLWAFWHLPFVVTGEDFLD
jgi:hypothetical protein